MSFLSQPTVVGVKSKHTRLWVTASHPQRKIHASLLASRSPGGPHERSHRRSPREHFQPVGHGSGIRSAGDCGRNVIQKDWLGECARSRKDPEGFWADYAAGFEWSWKWDRVLEWDGVHHKWFTGAKTNITINALDRHANSDRRNRAAFIWLGEDGSERIVTYGQLHRMVCRFANGLKSLGVVKGRPRGHLYAPDDRRRGRHAGLRSHRRDSFGGVCRFGAHRSARPHYDAQAKVVIVGDVGFRRGKTVALKASSMRRSTNWSWWRRLWCIRGAGLSSRLRAKSTSTSC
jgi:hypothetical protein